MEARDLIAYLRLEPLPIEGGFFRQTWCSTETVASASSSNIRPVGTAIYYLLTDEPDSFSALHRLPTDEVYHFYLGDPVQQLRLYPDGRHESVTLGADIAAGHLVQSIAPGQVWQGSRLWPGGRFALLGTTMAPGFHPSDYEGGEREALTARYPAARELIARLTRAT